MCVYFYFYVNLTKFHYVLTAAICQVFSVETAHVLAMGVACLVIKDPGMIPKL